MNTLVQNVSQLSLARQIAIASAGLIAVLAVFMIARMASQPGMSLLYSGLDPTASGEVLASLEQQGVAYDIRGASIFVPTVERDALRMRLAGEGLPSAGAQGYELLDGLSGFGTTSQMFDAAYWRAKEGELARTISANPGIRAARVHIAIERRSPLAQKGASRASVTLTSAGGGIDGRQVDALRHLVASAVPALAPSDVAVIDTASGLLQGTEDNGAQSSESRADIVRANVIRLLEARVGPGNAIVEVNLDTVTEHEQISERIIDPDSRVAISQDTEERANRASNAQGGAVTVASNLPDGDAGGSGRNSESNDSETRQTTNYDVSETRREVVREPGALRRMSVAVLVDGVRRTADDGSELWEARDDAEISALRDLVATAVGLDEERGDSLTIKSMQFNIPEVEEPMVVAGSLLDGLDVMQLIQLAVLAAVALILGLFVVRPILNSASNTPGLPGPAPLQSLEGPVATSDVAEHGRAEVLPALDPRADHDIATLDQNSPATRLRQLMTERERETLKVLGDWMNDDGRARG